MSSIPKFLQPITTFLFKVCRKVVRMNDCLVVPRFPPAPPARLNLLTIVTEALVARGTMPSVVQVGAADGDTNDPLARLLESLPIRIVLVEPIPELAERLRDKHRGKLNVTIANCAIDDADGQIDIYRAVSDDVTVELLQLSSFDRGHLVRHGVPDEHIASSSVKSVTLGTLLREVSLENVDILQVDTEGMDDRIVYQALKLNSPPAVINFEHVHLPRERYMALLADLRKSGYELAFSGMDTLAVRGMHDWVISTPGVAYTMV